MNRLPIVFCLMLNILIVHGENFITNESLYQNYCHNAKESQDLTISFPEKWVAMPNPKGFQYFTFGPQGRISPIFEYEPIVKLSKSCTLVLEFKMASRKFELLPDSIRPRSDYGKFGIFGLDMLLGNLEMPSLAEIHHNRNSNKKIKQEIDDLTTKYARIVTHGKTIKRAHCEEISILQIPHMEKLTVHKNAGAIVDFNPGFESENMQCYAVSFTTTFPISNQFASVRMLFFIDGNKTTIDKCIEKTAKHIRFE